ncbi:hypothetical protein AV955_gp092 [Diadromus pulchellus ascovirus 4a]|uniref:Complete DpAV4 genome n=1 Tax=Diadromus pulchellus ascovirus 4a TaxID=158683 RepID=F2NZ21_9VIRU|nr:hypothetical protein AV955_gp092 [Diadromus pulchellus ascovirus 4a]CCA61449.1 unnamed protein product [Diadromus pulchellus ascovirus 4a]
MEKDGLTCAMDDVVVGDRAIKMVGTEHLPWFRTRDVLALLGHPDADASNYVPNKYRRCLDRGNEHYDVYINKTGLCHVLTSCPNLGDRAAVASLDERFELDLDAVVESKKQDTLGPIRMALSEKYKTILLNYRLRRPDEAFYFVDMYVPDIDLVIECDEFAHRTTRRKEHRLEIITEKLKCRYHSYDPTAKGFNIYAEIGKIFALYC